jgi:hypothetical protein
MHREADMNWKAGDVAIIATNTICLPVDNSLKGATCELVTYLGSQHDFGICVINNCWEALDSCGKSVWVDEKCLRKPYDGNELCEWSDCVFQPKVLELVE